MRLKSAKLPDRLGPHVVVVVGAVCFDDPWEYAIEPLMPDRSRW